MDWRKDLAHPRDRLFAVIWGALVIVVFSYLGSLLWEIHRHDDWALFWTPPEAIIEGHGP